MKYRGFIQLVLFLTIFLVPLGFFYVWDFEHAKSLALLISITILWFTEFIPLPVTALLVPVVGIFYELMDAKEAFTPFGNQILFLFIGSFLLASSMQKHGLDKRMSFYLLSKKFAQRSLGQIIFVISAICWVLSMWVSNTAACAIVTPISLALASTLKEQFSSEISYKNFRTRILLTCAFASSIGGMATPVGSPPNLLALEFLAKNDIQLTFFYWLLLGIPISFSMLLTLNFLLARRYPIINIDIKSVGKLFEKELAHLGPVKSTEIQVASCFSLAVILWLLPGFVHIFSLDPSILYFAGRMPMGGVALFTSSILFVLPGVNGSKQRNLEWKDAKDIDWGTVVLFGGGLSLGYILGQSGLASHLGKMIFSDMGPESLAYIFAVAIALGILLSEFGSNTASATIILPILLGTFSHLPQDLLTSLVLATTFGTSFGFMLPVSTPPNAIIYGTRKIPLREMIKTGIYFDVLGFLVIYGFMFFYAKL